MQITADISKILKNVPVDLTFIFNKLSESQLGFASDLVFLAVENVVSFTKTCLYRQRGSVSMRNLCGNVFHYNWPQFGINVFDKIFAL